MGEDVGSGKGERAPGPAMLGREEAGWEGAGIEGAVAGKGAGVVSDASGDAWVAGPPAPAPGAEAGVAATLSALGVWEGAAGGAAGGVFRPNSMNVDPQSGSAGGLDKATPRQDTAFRRIVR
ncbi:hypothetical protein [Azospirillum doebereinerae]